jgi:lysophospholipase L1-like esterase
MTVADQPPAGRIEITTELGRSSRRTFLKRTPVAAAAIAGLASGLEVGAQPLASAQADPAPTPSAAGVSSRGVWVPPGWGSYLAPKLAAAAAGTGRATVALVGDSICRGFFSSNLDTAGWGGRVAAGLVQNYADGGSGFKSVADSATWMAGVSTLASPAITNFYQQAGNLFVVNGSWKAVTGSYLGPASVALKTAAPTDTLVANVRGSTVKIIWLNGGKYSMGSFTYSIDGGAPVSVAPTGVYEIAMASTSGLAAGPHTVTITAAGATATTETVILGVAGENSAGCTVNQFSRYGQVTAALDNGDQLQAGTWAGGWQYPCDLFLYSLGANDAHTGVTGDAWVSNVRRWLEGVYGSAFGGGSLGAVDGILVLPHIGSYESTGSGWVFQDYAIRARGLAEAYGLALIDLWTIGRNSWNWWKQQSGGSYWANADSPGASGSDAIHLSDAGHQFVATTVLGVISAALGTA